MVGDYDYTLYDSTVTGSGILAKCDIKVTKKNGTVEVKYTDDNCKVDYASNDGYLVLSSRFRYHSS